MVEAAARNDFEPVEQRLGLGPAVGLDHADHDVDSRFPPGVGALQHLVGLADPGSGADEDLQPAGALVLPPGCFKKRFRRGALFGIAALICHMAI
jgi:hypothetical protein